MKRNADLFRLILTLLLMRKGSMLMVHMLKVCLLMLHNLVMLSVKAQRRGMAVLVTRPWW